MNNTIVVGGFIFLADIPLSGQTGVPVDKATWYDEHGMPNPDNPQQIIEHRFAAEVKRKREQEENFWAEIGKKIKFTATVEMTEEDDLENMLPDVTPQCITNPYDIKLNFR